jgi:hypothetical protein
MHIEGYGPQDIEFPEDDYFADEPVCVCEQYVGTTQVAFCKACRMWTDDKELLLDEIANGCTRS